MLVDGTHYRTIWTESDDADGVWVIDQRDLPFAFTTSRIATVEEMAEAIAVMAVRGAPLIGAAAAHGLALPAAPPRLPRFLPATAPTAAPRVRKVRRSTGLESTGIGFSSGAYGSSRMRRFLNWIGLPSDSRQR